MANTLFDTFTGNFSRKLPKAAPVASESRNRGKKRNKKKSAQEKVFSRCNSQVSACEAFVQENCLGDAGCLTSVTPCCELMGECNFTGFVTCVNDATAV